MKIIKYFIEFIIVIIFFIIFKILGFRLASKFGSKIFGLFGPFFRSKKITVSNIKNSFPTISTEQIEITIKTMWENYGRILSEYIFIKDFRNSK